MKRARLPSKPLKRVLANTALSFRFEFERGQIQYVNNLELCHRRTGFDDYEEPQRKRLLVRVWLRDAGEMRYQGNRNPDIRPARALRASWALHFLLI